MGFFTRRTSWSVLELGLLKLCLVSVGIALGIWLYYWLQPFAAWFLIFYVVSGFSLLALWVGKLRKEK